MRYQVVKGALKGSISAPPSKSHTLRALLLATFAEGKSVIDFPLMGRDTESMLAICKSLGASIKSTKNGLEIEGAPSFLFPPKLLCGNSGIALRFLTALAALQTQRVTLYGDHSKRDMSVLINALNALGGKCEALDGNGYAPIEVSGKISGNSITISGKDSQPVSALLIMGALSEAGLTLHVTDPEERPWIDVTLDWLKRLGVKIERSGYTHFIVHPSRWKGFEYQVPGDWSSAAFPLVAALVTNSSVQVRNLFHDDMQGDKVIISLFKKMGVFVTEEAQGVIIHKGGVLQGGTYDLSDCIDALPALAALSCFLKGETHLIGIEGARKKESDRLSAMTSELRKMGGNVIEHQDALIIKQSALRGAKVVSHKDHRVAMALAVAALGASGTTEIDDVDWVDKTYPSFVDDIQMLGGNICTL